MIDDVNALPTRVVLARKSLAEARTDLDDAVMCLPNTGDDKVVATATVVDLLLRVVAARRHLEEVERIPNTGPPASLR
jgi:hypothetical protein